MIFPRFRVSLTGTLTRTLTIGNVSVHMSIKVNRSQVFFEPLQRLETRCRPGMAEQARALNHAMFLLVFLPVVLV